MSAEMPGVNPNVFPQASPPFGPNLPNFNFVLPQLSTHFAYAGFLGPGPGFGTGNGPGVRHVATETRKDATLDLDAVSR